MRLAAAVAICIGTALLAFDRAGLTETPQQRGAYLVNTVAACGRCHTPRDSQGNPIAVMALAGGFEFDDGVIGHVVGPNITPDRETGDRQLDRRSDRRGAALWHAAGRHDHRRTDADRGVSRSRMRT